MTYMTYMSNIKLVKLVQICQMLGQMSDKNGVTMSKKVKSKKEKRGGVKIVEGTLKRLCPEATLTLPLSSRQLQKKVQGSETF